MNHTLHLFRRDLRLQDNTALLHALQNSKSVSVGFVFDPRQLAPHPYKSTNGLQFLLQGLTRLHSALAALGSTLHVWLGDPATVVSELCRANGIDAVCYNRDYTPFARTRDQHMRDALHGIAQVHSHADALLTEPEQISSLSGTPYKIYSPFARACRKYPVRPPKPLADTGALTDLAASQYDVSLAKITREHLPQANPHVTTMGSRPDGLAVLEAIADHAEYKTDRDFPHLDKTTHLAAHHKFGTISARETYAAVQRTFGADHVLINQLYWRDFYHHVAWHWPHVFTSDSWNPKYADVAWDTNPAALEQWKSGHTGFPIVDAGMRELQATGHMHNRVRMITAAFLVKDLHVHWREGERHFAQHLVDYDPCVNNGSWQWAASTGTDAQPYFRIFNPWAQQKKWDPDAIYIKKWVPELRDMTAKEIHNWEQHHASLFANVQYPAPMVVHKAEASKAKMRFKVAHME